ncbi:heterodisulfide reductase-related iron-sulfur binding cluster [Acuticoccus sp. I52.16.1]|uniref:heterodisulfide reductase-related iron-sulfur binding cluster n=1 Tax=Acuticoccus sp. I52.16.1 TaxID=2928472 RepID=UPI001FD561EC|nr:heterodisulfide reductase-related iron-sulfur binding cluster [Acuticoccus sp. I52.16.1]UOM33697.1 heterodisulfide reductase-related iron-sulfur binding cluster [Acuticoccus sp. I52.16.1]
MQTNFSPAQLEDPAIRTADGILRACVHCGFCTATCPTFVLLGDERDSPRGRIYLIKEMLEADRPATAADTLHLDRCLSCLACMTTCPSGVNYMHLVDHARAHVEKTYRRPLADRLLRATLAAILPYPRRFRAALRLAALARPFAGLIAPRAPRPAVRATAENHADAENRVMKPAMPAAVNSARTTAPKADVRSRLGAMLALAPRALPAAQDAPRPAVYPATGTRKRRMALLTGCAQSVLAPSINAATVRLLNRAGVEIVQPAGEGCCGALVHHMGREDDALAAAKANITAWLAEAERGLDAIVITASGCGTTIKDYGFMLREDPEWADRAATVSALAKDVTEVLGDLDLGAPSRASDTVVAYHSACSMQHGQRIRTEPKRLLAAAGFTVKDVPEGHLCCGSAGTYNIMQPGIAARLKERKLANIGLTGADIVATGNIGCMTQLGSAKAVVHTVELLDWAYGGPAPAAAAPHLRERQAVAAA